jgi:serine/threonine protein kinase
MKKNLPDKDYFIGKEIPGYPGYKIVELLGSGCMAHVFKAHSDGMKHDLACKIIPRTNLKQRWQEEFLKANTIGSDYVVKFIQNLKWEDPENGIDGVILISGLVRGQTLEKYVQSKKSSLDINFIERFLGVMLNFFLEMEQAQLSHGDLHSKNVLVEERPVILGVEYVFRVTDFGVAGASGDIDLTDDYHQLALMLKQLLEKVDYQSLTGRDKFSFDILRNEFLARHLTENDTTRDPLARNPVELFKRLKQIDDDFNQLIKKDADAKILTPFDFLSCEQIGETHSLLKALYSDLFLGLDHINSHNNLVLTGPRGCGKSTVFKNLSLMHRCRTGDDKPENIDYIGVYYRCDDLYAAFPRYQLPDREEAYDIPIHYLAATLIGEMLASVEMWANHHFQDEFSRREAQISGLVWEFFEQFDIHKPQQPGADSFETVISRMQKERLRAQEKQRFASDVKHTIGYYFGPEVLVRVGEILIKSFSFLMNKPFYFFIDDYSMPRITEKLQKNLNRLLMQRNASCFFKLSTDSPVSYSRSDIDGKEYVEGREFELFNLGLVYLTEKTPKKLKFIEDIFIRRFGLVQDYPVKSLDELLGDYKMPRNNDLARMIRNRKKPEIWGKQVLCELCSGDIFYIIELVGKMVAKAGGTEGITTIDEIPRVDKKQQKKSVREEAGFFLDNLRRIEGGEKLVQVVTAFGNVAHSYLKYRNSKNEKNKPPHQASRIEPLEELNLSSDAQKIYKELLRYSLFIEDPRGKSRRGKVVPRLYLRRSLLPHFNLTFSTRDSLQLEPNAIEMLFLRPQEFEKEHKSEDDTQPLLPFEGGDLP